MAGLKGSLGLVTAYGNYNHVLNPSAETTSNYSTVGTATGSPTTYKQKYGLNAYDIQTPASGDGLQLTLSALDNVPHYFTARISQSKPFFTMTFKIGSTSKTAQLLEKIDDDWSLYGVAFTDSESNGATTAQILRSGVASGVSVGFWADGVQIEPSADGTYTTYIDGTQEGCRWLGAPHASRSQRSAESKAGGVVKDFYKEYGFFVERIIGAGAASQANQIDSYAQLPGGELNQIKVQSREFVVQGWFLADTEERLHENIQALELALSHDAHPGDQSNKIRFYGAKAQKEISAYYKGGLEGDLSAFYDRFSVEDDEWKFNAKFREKAAIQFDAPDPSWYEVGESAAVLDTIDSATFGIAAARLEPEGRWSNLGNPSGILQDIRAMVEDDTYVYFAGLFQNYDGNGSSDYIVRYNKITGAYTALDAGLNLDAYALAIAPNGDLYVGGSFTNASGVAAADYLAVWAVGASAFAAVGVPVSGAATITSVRALAFDRTGNLYIGGDFDNWANIAGADNVVMWDGSAYSALSTGADDTVFAIAVAQDNTVYIGGQFNLPYDSVAAWDGSAFTQIDTGQNTTVRAIAVSLDGLVYVAFGPSIQMWNGSSWFVIGTTNGTVFALAVGPDGVLYAGGVFTTIGGISTNNGAAKYNGSAWGHLDFSLAGAANIFSIMPSKYVDPAVPAKYSLWIGFDSFGTGTGYYADTVDTTNEGSWPAYPQIIINRSGGTGATIQSIRNERTGLTLLCDYDLLDGETVTIDLTPDNRKETSSFFGPVAVVLPNSNMSQWNLLAGDNRVSAFVSESGSPTVTAYLLWRDAYRSWN